MTGLEDASRFLEFWLEAGPSNWFSGGPAFDEACRENEGLWEAAAQGGHDDWMSTPEGALSLIILLDQIPRNIFRGMAKQFDSDEKALGLAKQALSLGYDRAFDMPVRNFFFLPLMHSETLADQQMCCDCLRPLNSRDHYYFALVHMDAIVRFGRFPHRNAMLGRETTDAERTYLETGGFGANPDPK